MNIDAILPYEKNARYNEKAIPEVAESIREFGLRGQIVLESRERPVIVAGHTRWAACKSLGWKEIPDEKIDYCDDLTSDQIMAYRLADNRTGEIATWNKALLKNEVRELTARGIDMSKFHFDFKSKILPYGAERLKTDKAVNLDIVNIDDCDGKWGMPVLEPVDFIPKQLIPFNYCKMAESFDATIHFCIDDYQFERLWNQPKKYFELISKFEAVICPDFSIYLDMPMPMKLWNIYRSRALGNWWQRQGLTVIPNLTWSDYDSFDYCFEGIPKHSTVFMSTVGVRKYKESRPYVEAGLKEALKVCQPSRILLYGGDMGLDFQGVEVKPFKPNTAFRKD